MTRTANIALLLPLVVACHRPPAVPRTVPPPVTIVLADSALSEWPTTLADALRAAEAGKFDVADQALLQYGLKHSGTREGTESDFWRAVLKADPLNVGPQARERMALFDAYLASGPTAPHYTEAMVFRRLLETVDSARAAVASLRQVTDARQRTREEEIRKLSDDLDRTMAELDRIKKRLAPVKQP
ncbi:MAG: hypothetical protein IT361_16200 [Gemmatimonadaceae bacterium]|nr:hypothetical protein [Gemmatimonadaceae bacterium]